ncbi:RNB domain-containing ribonuclease [Azospirillum baldaniorum]|uniref:RNB domain-containing ribonuclease n=1 Tax=Azospirillum baldaniorum TaxID=1064539 RepID=UPI00157ADB51|nr:RNB domain-containing ribonuclease [Azospirillum baldaniorum]
MPGIQEGRRDHRQPENQDLWFPESQEQALIMLRPTSLSVQHGLTIDGATSLDLDDAVHLEEHAHGLRLTVTVPDLSFAVPIGGPADHGAAARAFTRYAGERVREAMLPDDVTERASLLPDGPRPGIAFDMALDSKLTVTGFDIRRVTFVSSGRLTYADAETAVRTKGTAHHQMLALAWEVAEALLDARRRAGALALFDLRSGWMTTEEGQLQRIEGDRAHLGQIIVQEMMILTNTAAAEHARSHGIPILFRNHAPRELPTGDRSRLNALLAAAGGGGRHSALAFRSLAGPLGRASIGPECLGHFGLAALAYCHVTSPLRRYADLVNQRALLAAMDRAGAPYTHEQLTEIAGTCNSIEEEARAAKREGFKASVYRAAQRSLTHRRFDTLAAAEFRQLLRIVAERGDDGTVPLNAIRAALQRRLEGGHLSPQDITVALVDAGYVLGTAAVERIYLWLEENPAAAAAMWNRFITVEGWPAVTFRHQQAGPLHAIRHVAEGTAEIEGETFISQREGPERRVAVQLVMLSLIRRILGHEAPAGGVRASILGEPEQRVATATLEAVPTGSGLAPLPSDPKGFLLNEVAVKRRWEVAFTELPRTGPSHAPTFTSVVDVHGPEGLIASSSGTGGSKKAAEKAAALEVLPLLPADEAVAVAVRVQTAGPSPAEPNPISQLQEWCQKHRLPLPLYEFAMFGDLTKPQHQCTVRVTKADGDVWEAAGEGGTKAAAKTEAARGLYTSLSESLAA